MPEDLTAVQKTNAKDIQCVSWILRNITNPEALNTAIRLAGTVQWSEDGINVEPPYNVIVSVFQTCLDSTGVVYPGLSERVYYSARAMLWVHIRAFCISEELASSFPLPLVKKEMDGYQDLSFLLTMFGKTNLAQLLIYAGWVTKSNTHAHMQWTLYAILHRFWANQRHVGAFNLVCLHVIESIPWNTIPSDVTLNLLFVYSISLGHPVEGEALKIQGKTYDIPNFCFISLTHF